MNNLDFNKSISKMYEKKGLIERYGGDIHITISILFIISVIFFYIHISNNLVPIKKNWSLERCNPLVMPIAGFINNTEKSNKSNIQYTIDNFNFCLQNIISNGFSSSVGSFNNSLSNINDLFLNLGDILSSLINFISAVIKGIINLFLKIWRLLLQNTAELQLILNKIRDTISKLIGTVVTILYFQMFSFRTSIAWMVATPIFALYSIIIKQFISLLISCLAVQVLTTGRWIAFGACSAMYTVQNGVSVVSLTTFSAMISGFASAIAEVVSQIPPAISSAFTAVAAALAPSPAQPGFVAAATAAINLVAESIAEASAFVSEAMSNLVETISNSVITLGSTATLMGLCTLGSSSFIYMFFVWLDTIANLLMLLASLLLLIILFMFVKITLKGLVVGDNGEIPGLG